MQELPSRGRPAPLSRPFGWAAALLAATTAGCNPVDSAVPPGSIGVARPEAITGNTGSSTFAGDAQHTAVFAPAAQDLNVIRWSATNDLDVTGGVAQQRQQRRRPRRQHGLSHGGSTTTTLAANVPVDGVGRASFSTSALTADAHFITASYGGDGNFSAASTAMIQRVHASATTTALSALPNPSAVNQPVTFTATVAAVPPGTGIPTGMVTFQEGTAVLAQAALNGSGAASFSTSALSAGSHTLTAIYASDADFATSGGSAAQVVNGDVLVTFTSVAAQDGWVLESNETSNVGGTSNSSSSNTSALRAGDEADRRQYKTIVSFDTSPLPDGATIVSATLRLLRGTSSGTNPFTTLGNCWVDAQPGAGFSGSTALQIGDFQAPATAVQAASLSNAASDGAWSTGNLTAAGLAAIDKTGTTQLRVYFNLDDNNNSVADYIGYYSGDNATGASRPQLVVTYH
jgi:Bacterial Ig-like domain (group 3)